MENSHHDAFFASGLICRRVEAPGPPVGGLAGVGCIRFASWQFSSVQGSGGLRGQ